MNEITLENLDDSFFEDLREGNFILVLGAGFSYGVPNIAGGEIPIGDQFAALTKERFDLKTNLDYSSAAEVWSTKAETEENLLNEFRNLFLVDESKFDSKLYASIFLPNWYNIFTLNFDNVLEVTQQLTQKEQMAVYSYPDDGTDSEDPDILHLHGRIQHDTTFNSIVFTPDSYRDLPDKIHTPYNVLYGDVRTHKKKVLILGSQFKEITVRQKFFKELPKNKSVTIYHFDIKSEVEYVTDFIERDYTFVQLEKSKGGVRHFLQFLQENKDKIENVKIEGAVIINSSFVKRIQEFKNFTKADFYTAKQDDDCQWYGVLNDFDIVRNDYEKILTIARHCFDKNYIKKVAAVIHGIGGCGKSTLLRRLALQLHEEQFKIVWVNDRQFDDFVNKGLERIKEDISRNYLVIIEDWYRLTANENAYEFLSNSEVIRNLRIIIGDREIAGKAYISHLYNFENQFPLLPAENVKIIKEVLDKFPNWKLSAEKVLKNSIEKSTSLFLLLFVIARINEEQFGETEINFSDPTTAFRDIVKSDLKKIYAEYPGLAKALHNWASIYANHKLFIDFTSFLKIADAYNGDVKISDDFCNWNSNFPVMFRLKNYINVYKDSTLKNKKLQSVDLVRFNHDKLAEDGLAYVVLTGWDIFYNPITRKYENDKLFKTFIKVALEYGDDYFSSSLLSVVLQHYKLNFSPSEKVEFINKLYNKGNLQTKYLNHLADGDIGLTTPDLKKYLYELLDKKVYPMDLWLAYFFKADRISRCEMAFKILTVPDITSLHHDLVVAAFRQKGYDEKSILEIEEAKYKAAIKVLTADDITVLIHHIVVVAFNWNGYDEKSKEEIEKVKFNAAIKILTSPDITFLQHDIVVAAFNQKGYDEKSNQKIEIYKCEAAIKVLSSPDNIFLQHDIVVAAFHRKGYDEKSVREIEIAKYEATIRILTDPDITILVHHLVVAAFNQNGYDETSNEKIEKAKCEAALKILNSFDITSIQFSSVVAAIHQNGYNEESNNEMGRAKYEAAIKILTWPDITSIQFNIVVAAFHQKGYDEKSNQEMEKAKFDAAVKILEDKNWCSSKNIFKVLAALSFYASKDNLPLIVNDRIQEILTSFLIRPKSKMNRDLYFGLLGLPFFKNAAWVRNCEYVLANWTTKDRRGITNVLHAYKKFPDKIQSVCCSILKDWKREINMAIVQIYGDHHRGDHVKIALGHPNLKDMAFIVAQEMDSEERNNPNTVPEYILPIVSDIVNFNKFPEWKINEENESHTQQSE
jgi:hypothetical protein